MTLRTILLFTLLGCLISVQAQSNEVLAQVEQQLIKEYKALVEAEYEERNDLLIPAFRTKMLGFLKNEATYAYNFTELGEYVKIIHSADDKLKVYSWDEFKGGRWHDMIAIAQFYDEEGNFKTLTFNTSNSTEFGAYNDVLYYNIEKMEVYEQQYYIFFGWGSHGPDHQFNAVEVFKLENGELKRQEDKFYHSNDSWDVLAINAKRSQSIDLSFDAATKTISCSNCSQAFESDMLIKKGGTVNYKYEDGKFIKQ